MLPHHIVEISLVLFVHVTKHPIWNVSKIQWIYFTCPSVKNPREKVLKGKVILKKQTVGGNWTNLLSLLSSSVVFEGSLLQLPPALSQLKGHIWFRIANVWLELCMMDVWNFRLAADFCVLISRFVIMLVLLCLNSVFFYDLALLNLMSEKWHLSSRVSDIR